MGWRWRPRDGETNGDSSAGGSSIRRTDGPVPTGAFGPGLQCVYHFGAGSAIIT